jgi:putative ABC transport system substrate-binding protein
MLSHPWLGPQMRFDEVKRRDFIALVGGAVAARPRVACAQPSQLRHLAALMGGRNGDTDVEGRAWYQVFRQSLQELGWVEGRNLRADYRWPTGEPDRARLIAKEFVESKPDVLFGGNTISVRALLGETRAIPIVFANLIDPVGSGLVASLARPGGNVTGFTGYEFSLAGKWLEMLKEIAPTVTRIAMPFNPDSAPYAKHFLSIIEAAAPTFAVTVRAAPVHNMAETEAAIAAHAGDGGGLVLLPDPFTVIHGGPLIALANRHRLPVIASLHGFAIEGALLVYGPDIVDQYRRAARYVDRILKGEKPADLPVQAPTKYELESRLRDFEQGDGWSFCLMAGTLCPANQEKS